MAASSKLMKPTSAAKTKTAIGTRKAARADAAMIRSKRPSIGAVKRKGNVVARVVRGVDQTEPRKLSSEKPFPTKSACSAPTPTMSIKGLSRTYPHGVVDHSIGQHVVGAIHTNTIEGFWSILKRGIVGSFHKVSRKYLPLYVAEFQFRYNNRIQSRHFRNGDMRDAKAFYFSQVSVVSVLRAVSVVRVIGVGISAYSTFPIEIMQTSPQTNANDHYLCIVYKVVGLRSSLSSNHIPALSLLPPLSL